MRQLIVSSQPLGALQSLECCLSARLGLCDIAIQYLDITAISKCIAGAISEILRY